MVNPVLAWHAEYGAERGLVLHVEGSVVIDGPLFYFGTFVPKYGATAERAEGGKRVGVCGGGGGGVVVWLIERRGRGTPVTFDLPLVFL